MQVAAAVGLVGSIIQQLPASAEPAARRVSRAAARDEPALHSIAEVPTPAEEDIPAPAPVKQPKAKAAAGKAAKKEAQMEKGGKKAASGGGHKKDAATEEVPTEKVQPTEEVQPATKAAKRSRSIAAEARGAGAPAANKRAKRDKAAAPASISPKPAVERHVAAPHAEGAPPISHPFHVRV